MGEYAPYVLSKVDLGLTMKYPFDYLRPSTAEEAVAMKAEHADRACYWAGGTDLMLQWRAGEVDVDYCIDLTRVSELDFIKSGVGAVRIGAMASLDDLDHAASMNALMAVLGYTARLMCTKQTRTIGTVGGNMCNASPGADLSPLFVALDARATILGSNRKRVVEMEKFFTGVNQTVLSGNEMLYEISVPIPAEQREASYRRVARTVVDIALVSAAVSVTVAAGKVVGSRISLGSVATVPIRAPEAEQLLEGSELKALDVETLTRAGELAANAAKPISDVRAGAEYRRKMCAVLTRRALEDSIGKLNGIGA